MAEQLTLNQRVEGSSPSGLTSIQRTKRPPMGDRRRFVHVGEAAPVRASPGARAPVGGVGDDLAGIVAKGSGVVHAPMVPVTTAGCETGASALHASNRRRSTSPVSTRARDGEGGSRAACEPIVRPIQIEGGHGKRNLLVVVAAAGLLLARWRQSPQAMTTTSSGPRSTATSKSP